MLLDRKFGSLLLLGTTFNVKTTTLLPLSAMLKPLGTMLKPLGTILKPLGTMLKPLGTMLKALGTILKPLGTMLKPLGTILKPLGTILKPLGTMLSVKATRPLPRGNCAQYGNCQPAPMGTMPNVNLLANYHTHFHVQACAERASRTKRCITWITVPKSQ